MSEYIEIMKAFVLTGIFILVTSFIAFIAIAIIEIYNENKTPKT